MLLMTLVAIIFGAVIYIVVTIVKYTTFVAEALPAIGRLKQRRDTLDEGVESEEKLGEMIQNQVEQEEIYLSKLKAEIGEAKEALHSAEVKTDQLKFKIHKSGKVLPEELDR